MKSPEELVAGASAWWDTSIIDIHPGKIAIRGYPIEQLIGRVRFPEMIWLMLRGEVPTPDQAELLEAALVPGVDHGPHAPSIAISRMAVTCGLPVNGAMASAINVLDDIHGGAGQQCMERYREIDALAGPDGDLVAAATSVLAKHRAEGEKIMPGFGNRFHPVDPRVRDAMLPWDIIDGGMKSAFYRSEFDKALRAEWTLPAKRVQANAKLLPVIQ